MTPSRRLAVFILALLLPTMAGAAGDPFMGTWHLNKAKSTIARDPGVKSKIIAFSPAPGGGTITETVEMLAGGEPQVTRLSYVYGKYVAQGRTDLDSFKVDKNGRTMFWTAQLKGKPLARLQVDMSPDGRQLTFRYLSDTRDSSGAATKDRYVYDRG